MSKSNHQKYIDFINDLFDGIKKRHNINTDLELADFIGEARGNISQYRSGKRLLNDWSLIKICEDGGFSLSHTLNMILFKKSLKKDAEEGIRKMIESLTSRNI